MSIEKTGKTLVALLAMSLGIFQEARGAEGGDPSMSSKEMMNPEGGVSLATGDLGLSIPLMTVAGRGADFPLVLNYQSGIKVDEEASPVGLGFTLSTGFIMNVVNSCADDSFGGSSANGCAGMLNGGSSDEERDQDVFIMNIGGRTTRLMYDNNLVFHTVPWQPIKIQYWDFNGVERPQAGVAGARIVRFLVTMPDGTRYLFDRWRQSFHKTWEVSRTFLTSDAEGDPTTIDTSTESGRWKEFVQGASTWYLSAILAPNFVDNPPMMTFGACVGTCVSAIGSIGSEDFGGWVKFEYADFYSSSQAKYRSPPPTSPSDTNVRWQLTQHDAIRANNQWVHQYSFFRKELEADYFYPSQITTPLYKAVFTLGSRSDLNLGNARRINSIQLLRNNAASTPVAKVVFGYDTNGLAQGAPFSSNGRLTLRSVTKFGADQTTSMPPILFSYYNDTSPVTYSRDKVDFWGYRNNSTVSPSTVYSFSCPGSPTFGHPDWCSGVSWSAIQPFIASISSDLSRFAPDLNSARAWNLKSMTTPSGAVMTYNYELDTYGFEQEASLGSTKTGGGLRVSSVDTFDGLSSTTLQYQYEDGVVLRHAELSNSATINSLGYTSFFIGGYSERLQVGSDVAYAKSTEILPGNNGRIVHQFTTSREVPDTTENRWGQRLTSRDWKRGFENQTTFLNSAGGVVRTVTQNFVAEPSTNLAVFTDYSGNSDGQSDYTYTIESGWLKAISQVSTEDGISIEKMNSIFNPVNGMPELVETYRPFPQLVDQTFTTFAISSGAGIGADRFINKHILTAVAHQESQIAGQTTAARGVQSIYEELADGRIVLDSTFATAGAQSMMLSDVRARNSHGLPTQVFNPASGITTTVYDSSTGVIPVTVTDSLGHVSEVEKIHDAFLVPEVSKAPDGTRSKTEFDTFGRSVRSFAVTKVGSSFVPVGELRGVSSSDSALAKVNYDNLYKGTALSSTNLNVLENTTVLGTATSLDAFKNQVKVDSLDGLGRVRKSCVSGTAVPNSFCSVQTYDVLGAAETATGPSGITSKTVFESDPRHRPIASIPNLATPNIKTSTVYGTDPANGLVYTITTLPKGNHDNLNAKGYRTHAYKDLVGRTVKTIEEGSGALADRVTLFFYNGSDLTRVQDPKGLNTKFFYDVFGRKIGTIHPDMGTFSPRDGASIPENVSEQWSFNVAGQVVKFWNPILVADGKHLHTFYDAIGRSTVTCSMLDSVSNPNVADCDVPDLSSLAGRKKVKVVSEYDLSATGMGKLGRVSDGVTTTELTYDSLGRVSQKTITFNTQLAQADNVYITKFGFNNAGELQFRTLKPGFNSSVDPSNPSNVIRFMRDAMGRLTEVAVKKPGASSFQTLASGYQFTADGLLEEFTRGSGVTSTFTYDPDRRWLTDMELSGFTPTNKRFERSYERDELGNIFRIYDGLNRTGDRIGDFTFDVFSQLTTSVVRYQPSATCSNCMVAEAFSYDVDGNRTSYTYMSPNQTFLNRPLTYVPNTNRLNVDHRGIQYVYDVNGNIIQKLIP